MFKLIKRTVIICWATSNVDVDLYHFSVAFSYLWHFKMTEISQTACRAHENAQKITTCQEAMSLWAIKSAFAETEGGLLYLNRASECNRFILSLSRCMAAGGVRSPFTGCLKRLEYARELTYSTALWLQHIRKHLAHPQQEQMPQLGGVNQRNQMWQDYTCGNRCCHYNPRNKLLLSWRKSRRNSFTQTSLWCTARRDLGLRDNATIQWPKNVFRHLKLHCIALDNKIANQVASANKFFFY